MGIKPSRLDCMAHSLMFLRQGLTVDDELHSASKSILDYSILDSKVHS